MRVFYRWLLDHEHVADDPTSRLEFPKAPYRLPRIILEVDQIETVLAAADIATALGLRNRTMLEVLYATGLRRAELARLGTSDINLHQRTVFIQCGKGQQDRLVPLGQRATGWISRYLSTARPELVADRPDPAALFVTRDATSISHAHIGRVVELHLRQAGIPTGNCHLFRHALATLMLRAGADIRWVQAILGHHSLTSTQLYTHVEISHLAAVLAATHPANRPAPGHDTLIVHITGVTARRLVDAAAQHGLDPHQLLDHLLPTPSGH